MPRKKIQVPAPAPLSVPDDQLVHGEGIPLVGPPPVAPASPHQAGLGGAFDPDTEVISAETVQPSGKGPDLAGKQVDAAKRSRPGPGGGDPPDRVTY